MTLLPVNVAWYAELASGRCTVEYRSASARWRRALVAGAPRRVTFANGYDAAAPRAVREVLAVDVLPSAEVPAADRLAHGFAAGGQIIRMTLGSVLSADPPRSCAKRRRQLVSKAQISDERRAPARH